MKYLFVSLSLLVSSQVLAVEEILCRDSIYESSETGSGSRIESWQFSLSKGNDNTYSLWYNYWKRNGNSFEDLVAGSLTCKFNVTDKRLFSCRNVDSPNVDCIKSTKLSNGRYAIENKRECSQNTNPIPRRTFYQTAGASGCFVK